MTTNLTRLILSPPLECGGSLNMLCHSSQIIPLGMGDFKKGQASVRWGLTTSSEPLKELELFLTKEIRS